ncbi:hypothetical protein BSFA1_80920 (plasmid) [Burkholderia sp. SFA1]|jgi:hypothetical protein|uniref:Uncharacterized protein n=1 Tax=Burkholderia vietnamiensis (strain G4 / LMG 22486) TaxID=269482 RepID=A4JUA8_BURVG|nr:MULTISPECIES: hypothetical protein [Caballeronia]ABO59861.1 hypothetical protein Bcep1808_6975 [Burkholderia vietnamiensis G4]AET95347.1 hypothetical protein BYI23_E001860 [Burkholderia sp. YI23]MCB4349978.1 hypothetical protein [Burkholderia vietnamiensis]BBQ02964.1 hypothetical protein BSFA1_80920 [Burkholderia sp. SFA1]MDR5798932.1 hypothetical protein [Caballeronia sp. LZ001]
MKHIRSHWRTYRLAAIALVAVTLLFYAVLLPVLGVALHLFSIAKIAVILLITGALLRFLIHAVDDVERKHGSVSGQ